jgi:hypothetical protein
MKLRALVIAPLLLAAAACNPAKNLQTGDTAVTTFHQQYNQQQFAAIYAGSDAALKEASPEPDFTRFIAAVRRKLGAERTAKRTGWNVQAATGGSFVTLTYDTQFEKGDAAETFRLRISGGKAQIMGYNITSPALVTN